jgi:hypothetical protein
MFLPSLRTLVQTLSGRAPRAGCRPWLEGLEDRCVPSSVTNLNDAGPGSLRQALLDTPAGGTVDFQTGLRGTITLTSGELAITKTLTVAGPGSSVLRVSGNHASRVFDIAAMFTVSISGLTVADGLTTTGANGGIFNAGVLTVTDSTISGNTPGGGISNNGTVTVTGSTISGNTVTGGPSAGGGISNTGTLTVTGSTLSGNTAAFGGGIDNEGPGTMTVTDSALSGNTASTSGGGIHNGGTLTVTDSALSGNTAGNFGGGIYNGTPVGTPPVLTIAHSTLNGNSAGVAGSGIYNAAMLAVRGVVTVDGDYFQTATGTLTVFLGGLTPGSQYSQLLVRDKATLAGTLSIVDVNGFVPDHGDRFNVLSAGNRQGHFAHPDPLFAFDYTDHGLTLVFR